MNDLKQIEEALEAGQLWACMGGGHYWRCRRNGRTKLWKTRPGEFRIPIKAGFRSCGYVTHRSNVHLGGDFEIRRTP